MAEKKFKLGRSSPPWMLTYSDMVTILLVFFVLLFTLSDINIVKFSQYFQKMKKPPVVVDEQQLRRLMLELAQYAKEHNLEDKIYMEIDEKGLNIRLTESLMFKSGEAEILPGALPILSIIADKLKNLNNQIIIEGHTDNVPIRTERFPSNWELSVTRAVNVLKNLIEKNNLDPTRISAAGYGEHKPIASNKTAEGRAKNRRVVLIVLRQRLKGF
ncbi:MAG: OmpA family protein [Candidatus Omnitrophica bacterium]|nr:OmpA family protein [Candidatus Omnitrophota bacterium]MBD3269143.1 OmpA family protein [Candidatus Omnitrophota bacterium]